jgi:hypothetical protein
VNTMTIRRHRKGESERIKKEYPELNAHLPPSRRDDPEKRTRNYSGREFEQDFIGLVPSGSPSYRNELLRCARPEAFTEAEKQGHSTPYVQPDVDALNLVFRFQPSPPTEPKKPFGHSIRLKIAKELRIPEAELDTVKFYTTVGTSIDRHQGVDAFLDIVDPQTKTIRRVTFDLSLGKREAPKADILVHDLPIPDIEAEEFERDIDWYAKEAAKMISNATPFSADSGWPPLYA